MAVFDVVSRVTNDIFVTYISQVIDDIMYCIIYEMLYSVQLAIDALRCRCNRYKSIKMRTVNVYTGLNMRQQF